MDQNEQEIINGLFNKLKQAEQNGGPRDAEAERLIGSRIGSQPAAPYYMAQAILVQEHALQVAQDRIRQLEQDLEQRPAGGGFLGGLFGAGQPAPRQAPRPPSHHNRFADYQQRGGSGFMAGAMQTALGVAGGVVLGNLLMDAFTPDDAMAGDMGGEEPVEEDAGGFEDGGDFGMDEF